MKIKIKEIMKFPLFVMLLSFPQMGMAQGNSPDFEWAKAAGGTGSDSGNEISVDNSGNSYIVGDFSGTAIFGNTTLTSAGSSTVFIAKLDADGNFSWAKNAGGSGYDKGFGIYVDPQGNSYATGHFSGTATFGNTILTSSGNWDMFITKLDTDGNFIWTKNIGATYRVSGIKISADNQGNIYVTGMFSGTALFGNTSMTSDGDGDIFIVKLDPNGNIIWARSAGGPNSDSGRGISVDSQNNIYITGSFRETAHFGNITVTSEGSDDAFIAKLDTNGNFLWAKGIGDSSYDAGRGISVDMQNNCYVVGHFSGTAIFGNITLTSSEVGDDDVFITKLDENGNFIWAKKGGDIHTELGHGISVDRQGNSIITGQFTNTTTFGNTTLFSNGSDDIFIAKLDTNGNFLWAKEIGGGLNSTESGYGISMDHNGNSYTTGYFSGTATFGNTTLTSSGDWDVFIAKLEKDFLSVTEDSETILKIYPNPVNNRIFIENGTLITKVTLRDLNGRRIISKTPNSTETELDITQLSQGVYILEIKSGNNTSMEKIVKR